MHTHLLQPSAPATWRTTIAPLAPPRRKSKAELRALTRQAGEAQDALAAARAVQGSTHSEARQAATDARRLEGRIAQLEHACRAKDAEAARLQGLLEKQREREVRRARADEEALARLRRAFGAAQLASGARARGAALASGSRGLKALDIVSAYEDRVAALQRELATARAENRLILEAQQAGMLGGSGSASDVTGDAAGGSGSRDAAEAAAGGSLQGPEGVGGGAVGQAAMPGGSMDKHLMWVVFLVGRDWSHASSWSLAGGVS